MLSDLALLPNAWAAEESTGARWALLIGVNDYANLQDLKYCSDDVQALQRRLLECGFDADHVITVRSGASDSRYFPSKSNIEQQLKLITGLAQQGDFVVVVFSGHGLLLDNQSFLCPADAQADDKSTLVPLADVFAKLDGSRASLKLLVADACRNDPRPGRKSASAEQDLRRLGEAFQKPPQGMLVLTSCTPGEAAIEDDEFKQSVFMHFMLEGLGGPADKDGDGQISIYETASYAAHKTKLYVMTTYNDLQRPDLKATVEALSFPLATVNVRRARPAPAPRSGGQDALEGQVAGQERSDNGLGLKLAWCPPGSFEMGSPDARGEDDERPRHRVTLSRGFWLGKYELTQGQWKKVVGTAPWSGQSSVKEGPSFPVTYISWEEAISFCRKLTDSERSAGRLPAGWEYSLPTEAEWEYACRAGMSTAYVHGDDESQFAKFAWYEANALDAGENYAHQVGQKQPNAWGLQDMHGNVWEWCHDWYSKDYYAKSPPTDPPGAASGSYRVGRGGSWEDYTWVCRSAFRSSLLRPSYRGTSTGFRVALVSSRE